MLRTIGLAAVFFVIALMPATDSSAEFSCTRYRNTAATYDGPDYGWVCSGSGTGCTECINFHPGGVQWCVWGTPSDIYCIDQAY
jgi:hypothetical protein